LTWEELTLQALSTRLSIVNSSSPPFGKLIDVGLTRDGKETNSSFQDSRAPEAGSATTATSELEGFWCSS